MADLAPNDLSYEDVDAWASDLKLDWPALLTRADLGKTQKYVVKNRWGDNPEQMNALWATLKEIEESRAKKTATGLRMAALERWRRLGVVLSHDMIAFRTMIDEAATAAAKVEEKMMEALQSPTAEPHGNRK